MGLKTQWAKSSGNDHFLLFPNDSKHLCFCLLYSGFVKKMSV